MLAALLAQLVALIKTVPAVVAATAPVYNHVPQTEQARPYVVIRVGPLNDASDKTHRGYAGRAEIHVFSAHRGDQQALTLVDAIAAVCHNAALTIAGGQVVVMRQQFASAFLEPDGVSHQGVLHLQLILST